MVKLECSDFFCYTYLLIQSFSTTNAQLESLPVQAFYNNPVEICMLSGEVDVTAPYEKVLEKCRKNNPNGTDLVFGGLKTFYSAPEGFCCTAEINLEHRGYSSVIANVSTMNVHYTSKYPLHDFFDALEQSNTSVLSIGDSTSSQMDYAMVAELSRSGRIEDVTSAVKNEILQAGGDVAKIFGVWKRNRTYLYSINLFEFDDEQIRRAVEVAVDGVISRHSSLIIIANMGHHLRDYIRPHNRANLIEIMAAYLSWLDGLQKLKNTYSVIYRESTPSHFDSFDGTYEAWKHPDEFKIKRQPMPSDSQFPLYNCKELSQSVHNRPENIVAKQLIQRRGFNFHYLHVFNIFKYYWKMHSGNCYYSSDRTAGTDCVHLCQYARSMWLPIWSQLADIMTRSNSSSTASAVENQNCEKEGKIHFVRAITMSSSHQSNRVGVANFISCEGIWHEIPNNETLAYLTSKLLGITTIERKRREGVAWELVGVAVVDIRRLVDGAIMLRTPINATVYIVTEGSKKAPIPSYEVFHELGGSVVIPLVVMPPFQLDLLETTAFVMDDFVSCGQVAFIKRISSVAKHTATHYMQCNCKLHKVPDKETFHFLHDRQISTGGQPAKIVEQNIDFIDTPGDASPCISTELMVHGKAMIKSPDEPAVYVMVTDWKKALVPSYEVFEKLGGTVTVPVLEIPQCQLDLVETVPFVTTEFEHIST